MVVEMIREKRKRDRQREKVLLLCSAFACLRVQFFHCFTRVRPLISSTGNATLQRLTGMLPSSVSNSRCRVNILDSLSLLRSHSSLLLLRSLLRSLLYLNDRSNVHYEEIERESSTGAHPCSSHVWFASLKPVAFVISWFIYAGDRKERSYVPKYSPCFYSISHAILKWPCQGL